MSVLLRFACLVLVLFSTAPSLAQGVDLEALRETETNLSREVRSLGQAVERQRVANQRAREQVDDGDRLTLTVTLSDLRQAQFEARIARTRALSLEQRVNEELARIERVNQAIVAANAQLSTAGPDTLQRLLDEVALEWRVRIRERAGAMVNTIEELSALYEENASLREEQLEIIQRAVTLDALDGYADAGAGPLMTRIEALVARLSQEGLALTNEAAEITDENPAATRRRNLLRLRADELLVRANARRTDAVILEARNVIDALSVLPSEEAVPVRLFDEAALALNQQADLLAGRRETTDVNARALGDLLDIVRDPSRSGAEAEAVRQRAQRLRDLLSVQRREMMELTERIEAIREDLQREEGERVRGALFQRADVRIDDPATRAQIRAELRELPAELRAVYGARLTEVRTALSVASNERLGSFAFGIAIFLAITVYLRQRLLKRFIAAEATKATQVPLEVLRRNLFWLFPLGVWAIFTELFAISRETALAMYPLFAIPAAAALLRDLVSVIVSRRESAGAQRIGRIISRAMEVAMVLATIVVFAYVVLAELPLLPSTQSAINRLVYVVFVLSALPMLLFVFFFTAGGTDEFGERTKTTLRAFIAGGLSLLPPAALIATGVAGLSGYTNLAALLLEQLAVAITVAAALALSIGILADVLDGVVSGLRTKDPGRAYFIQTNFLQPVYRLGQLTLVTIAFITLAVWFNWNAETPGIAEVLSIWNTSLFTVNNGVYTVGSVAIGLLALLLVFWFAAWCRRVAYSVLLRNVRDLGIRQSLSTFAQYVVVVIGVLLTLSAIGFDVTTLTVFAASLGVGIGFGLQNVVNNFISGVLLVVERPLRIGDIVTVAGQSGTVSQIGIRAMRMRTFDEFDLVVPNSQLVADTFTNWTRSNSLMRVLITVGISYNDTPEDAVNIVAQILNEHPGVVSYPEPMVTVDEFGDSSINLRVCYYIDLRGEMSGFVIRSEVLATIWRRFGEEGISIPFPQRDVHMIAAKGLVDPRERTAVPEVRYGARDDDYAAEAVEQATVDD